LHAHRRRRRSDGIKGTSYFPLTRRRKVKFARFAHTTLTTMSENPYQSSYAASARRRPPPASFLEVAIPIVFAALLFFLSLFVTPNGRVPSSEPSPARLSYSA